MVAQAHNASALGLVWATQQLQDQPRLRSENLSQKQKKRKTGDKDSFCALGTLESYHISLRHCF
jgi:hypothetical protein